MLIAFLTGFLVLIISAVYFSNHKNENNEPPETEVVIRKSLMNALASMLIMLLPSLMIAYDLDLRTPVSEHTVRYLETTKTGDPIIVDFHTGGYYLTIETVFKDSDGIKEISIKKDRVVFTDNSEPRLVTYNTKYKKKIYEIVCLVPPDKMIVLYLPKDVFNIGLTG